MKMIGEVCPSSIRFSDKIMMLSVVNLRRAIQTMSKSLFSENNFEHNSNNNFAIH